MTLTLRIDGTVHQVEKDGMLVLSVAELPGVHFAGGHGPFKTSGHWTGRFDLVGVTEATAKGFTFRYPWTMHFARNEKKPAQPALARDPDPLVPNGKRLAVARHTLIALGRNSAPRGRVKSLLRTLVEEDPQNASRYVALSRRKCASGRTPAGQAALSRVAVGSLQTQGAQAAALLGRLNAGEPVTLGDAPAQPPALFTILAWVRREIAEINGSLEG